MAFSEFVGRVQNGLELPEEGELEQVRDRLPEEFDTRFARLDVAE